MDKQTWIDTVLGSLAGISRTLGGASDTSCSADKPKLGCQEGEALASRTEQNLRQALDFLWESKECQFRAAAEVLAFVETLAATVSEGLLADSQSFYRTWETKFGQTPVHAIEAKYMEFCGWLFRALANPTDFVEIAALVEQRLDGKIHPFADGCGRTAKLLAAFVLLRGNRTPPQYRARSEYYRGINKSETEWVSCYRSLCR